MELPCRRRRGRYKRRFMGVVKKDMQSVGVTEEDVRGRAEVREDHPQWRPLKEQQKEEN